jgi:hypothetical protein
MFVSIARSGLLRSVSPQALMFGAVSIAVPMSLMNSALAQTTTVTQAPGTSCTVAGLNATCGPDGTNYSSGIDVDSVGITTSTTTRIGTGSLGAPTVNRTTNVATNPNINVTLDATSTGDATVILLDTSSIQGSASGGAYVTHAGSTTGNLDFFSGATINLSSPAANSHGVFLTRSPATSTGYVNADFSVASNIQVNNGHGVRIDNGGSGSTTLSNAGSVTGGQQSGNGAIQVNASNTTSSASLNVTNLSSGVLTNRRSSGIAMSANNSGLGTSTITNAGTINANSASSGAGSGVFLSVSNSANANQSTVTNSGTVNSTNNALSIISQGTGLTRLENTNSGVLSMSGTLARGMSGNAQGGDLEIENLGSITGVGNSSRGLDGQTNSGSMTLTNAGGATISAAIGIRGQSTTGGAITINNDGTITKCTA